MTAVTEAGPRFQMLDIIRGVAVMGIFSVNVIAFAMIEGAYFNPPAYGGYHGVDLALWIANLVVIDGKMRSLFSMLFGASMLLVIERAEASGRSGLKTHLSRMVVLLLIGVIHYDFIWSGDILHLYAAVGLVAYFFRNLPPRALLASGALFMIFQMVIFSDIVSQAVADDIAAHAPGAPATAIRAWNDFAEFFYPTPEVLAKDTALYGGSFAGIARHWLVEEPFNWVRDIVIFSPETLGLMLFGMAGYRSGFLTGLWTDDRYRKIAIVGISLGALASVVVAWVDIASHFYLPVVFGNFVIGLAPFRPVMAAGYAALIILLARDSGWLAVRLAAVGRAAFTNYLGTSLIAAFVFYGWGLGYYGKVSRFEAWLLVPPVWLLMLAWSKPWLDRFNYAPFEWLWRSLSRGTLQPMRRPAAA